MKRMKCPAPDELVLVEQSILIGCGGQPHTTEYLEYLLEYSIEREYYENAAEIRDELKRRKADPNFKNPSHMSKGMPLIQGERVYHISFGWATVHLPPADGLVLLDLEAKSAKFYVAGHGYRTAHRNEEGHNFMLAPESQIYREKPAVMTNRQYLIVQSMNVTLEHDEEE